MGQYDFKGIKCDSSDIYYLFRDSPNRYNNIISYIYMRYRLDINDIIKISTIISEMYNIYTKRAFYYVLISMCIRYRGNPYIKSQGVNLFDLLYDFIKSIKIYATGLSIFQICISNERYMDNIPFSLHGKYTIKPEVDGNDANFIAMSTISIFDILPAHDLMFYICLLLQNSHIIKAVHNLTNIDTGSLTDIRHISNYYNIEFTPLLHPDERGRGILPIWELHDMIFGYSYLLIHHMKSIEGPLVRYRFKDVPMQMYYRHLTSYFRGNDLSELRRQLRLTINSTRGSEYAGYRTGLHEAAREFPYRETTDPMGILTIADYDELTEFIR